MKQNSIYFLTFLFALFLFSCSEGDNKDNDSDTSAVKDTVAEVKKDCNEVHWAYKDLEGPEHWAKLCPGFSACSGTAQSPVDIKDSKPNEELTNLKFDYQPTKVNIVNNGHTIQFNIDDGSKVVINEKEYKLLQFHFHAKSEHTVNGEHHPAEAHFVHKYGEDELAVVGVLFNEGKENELFSKFIESFPHSKGDFKDSISIDFTNMLPAKLSYYHYKGSLTTPPCSEIVNWYVLQNPITASAEQITKLSEILHNNYRPVMPINERVISSFNE